jgi:cytosine/adenosine deaminase-related metal-dependent hydrolase/ubiquinone/menaquinone biosynthesis C-methylase UbiE
VESSPTLTRTVSAAEGYRRWSAVYDSDANPMLSLERRFLECLLPPVEGRDIVDLGCGTGRWLKALAARSPRSLVGLDFSAEMLAQAKKKLGGRAILLAGRCEAPSIESASADLILCSFVLSYISNIGRFIEQIRCIARPNADIFISDLHPGTEAKLGWRRGFRDGGDHVEVETHRRPLASILASFERQQIRPVAILEPRFGDPEFEILKSAGKSELISDLRNEPAIYLLHLRALHGPAKGGSAGGSRGCVGSVPGGRVGLGPAESADADVRFEHGRIAFIDSEGYGSSSRAAGACAADLSGFLLLPGLINAHDHLEFALFPRLGRGCYRNFTEWADDIHRANASPIREHRAVPKSTRLWWGAIRNLLCGVTTVCHHNPFISEVFDHGFPIRVMRDFGWAHSIPMEGNVARRHADTPPEQPFILHLGEGVDRASAEELFELDRKGALTDRTVVVHGLGLSREALSLLKSRGAALVWCPSSNTFLFGRTLHRGNLRMLSLVALGSDSSLTAEGDLLDEVRFARERVSLTAEELYAQVTLNASRVLRLRSGEGSLRVGALADLIAIRDRNLTPAETLARSTYRDVELVLVGGRVQLASPHFKARLQPECTKGLEPLKIDGEVRWIRAPLARLFEEGRQALGPDLTMNGRTLNYVAA